MATMTTTPSQTSPVTRPVRRTNQSGEQTTGQPDLIKTVLGSAEISLSIPDTATLGEVENTLSIAINGHKQLIGAAEALKPIIGRLLLTIRDRTLYKPDFKSFTDYITTRVVTGLGLSRSNAFEALRIANAFPTLTTEQYRRYGATRLLLAAKVTNETAPNYTTILDESTKIPVDEFRRQIKDAKVQSGAHSTMVTITIRTTGEVRERWHALLNETQAQASDLLVAMMDVYATEAVAGTAS